MMSGTLSPVTAYPSNLPLMGISIKPEDGWSRYAVFASEAEATPEVLARREQWLHYQHITIATQSFWWFLRLAIMFPVDVGVFYTNVLDSAMHCFALNQGYMTQMFQMTDSLMRLLIDTLEPEMWIVVSDHGMQGHEKRTLYQTDDGTFIVSQAGHYPGGVILSPTPLQEDNYNPECIRDVLIELIEKSIRWWRTPG